MNGVRADVLEAYRDIHEAVSVRWAVRRRFLAVLEARLTAPASFPVTDDGLDAPDGAVVDGYERHGDRWVRL